MLRSAGLDRRDFLITNVFDQKADENNVQEFMNDPAIVAENFARLALEIQAAAPSVIVPLGATALWAFTGKTAITPYRGSVTAATRIAPGAKLLPTFHPALVMRQWKFLPVVVGDLIKAAKEAAIGPQIVYPQRKIYIEPGLSDIKAFMPKCVASDLLSVDIETGWGQITSIAFAPSAYEAMCIPFVDLRQADRSYWRRPMDEFLAWKMVAEILSSAAPKLGQNFTYDAIWLLKKMGMRVNNYRHDTRLIHHALYPELPKDLAFMGGSYTNIGAWKQWGGRYSNDKRDN